MTKYGYEYINMFGDRILIGSFNSKKSLEEYVKIREKLNKRSADPETTEDKSSKVVIWNLENYNYVYTPGEFNGKIFINSRVIKEIDERDDFVPDNWEEFS